MNTDVVKLGEITSITKLAGFEFTKYFNYNQTGEIIALRALNLRNGKLDLTDIHRIDKSISDKLPRSKLYKGDILFTYTGNGYGDCALVDEDDKYHLAPNICKITSNQEKVDYTFLFYTIRSKSFYGQVSGFIGGSGQPTIPMERIRKLKIFLPKMQVQQKIANILSRYDEAIENNNKRIKLLEQMAQNLYKEWFVRFRFPGYENCEFENGIPVGWKVCRLKDFGKIITGKTPPTEQEEYYGEDVMFVKTPDMHGNIFVQSTSEYLSKLGCEYQKSQYIPENSIMVSCIGTGGITSINAYPANTNQQINSIILDDKNNLPWLYFTVSSMKETIKMFGNTGTTMTNLSKGKFEKLKVLKPYDELIQKFSIKVNPIFERIKLLNKQITNLAKQRDLLLPRLMSGELEVR